MPKIVLKVQWFVSGKGLEALIACRLETKDEDAMKLILLCAVAFISANLSASESNVFPAKDGVCEAETLKERVRAELPPGCELKEIGGLEESRSSISEYPAKISCGEKNFDVQVGVLLFGKGEEQVCELYTLEFE